MSAVWTLKFGEDERPLSAWGIVNPRCSFRSFAADELSFEIPLEDAFADPTFPYGSQVTLFKDGSPWFIGTVTQEQASAQLNREEHGYVVSGPWWQLSRCVFQQFRCVKSEDFSTTRSELSTRVVLGQSDTGLRLTTTEQVSNIVTYAISRGVAFAIGSISGGIGFPYQEARDLTCAEAIMRMVRRTPDAVSWFDYSTGTPVFNVARRADLAAVALDATAANALEKLDVRSRPDLAPPGVRFIFITSEQNEGTAYTKREVQEAGSPDDIGGVIATIEPMGEGSDRPEKIPSGLAADYFAALSTIPYEGNLSTRAEDCGGVLRPGKKLNISNGRAAWAEMAALIQTVTEELATGVTTAEFGPPEQLGPQDFAELLTFNRQAPFNTSFYRVRNCLNTVDKDEGDDPSEGDTTEENSKAAVAPGAASTRTADIFKQLLGQYGKTLQYCDEDTGEKNSICVIAADGACEEST